MLYDVVKWFEEAGFKVEEDISYDIRYVTGDEKVAIAIFGYEYDHEEFNSKLVMEQKEVFDKWRKAYYIREIPCTRREFEEVLSHIKLIATAEHVEKSRNFEKFFPEKK